MQVDGIRQLGPSADDDYVARKARPISSLVSKSLQTYASLHGRYLLACADLSAVATGRGPARRAVTLILCCSSVLVGPQDLLAAKWSNEPFVAVGAVHNDNIRLTTGPHDSVSGVNLTPGVSSRRETSTSLVNIDALLNATRYSDNDEQDDLDEQIIRLRSRGQTSERNSWRVNGRLVRDTLLRTVDIPGDADPDDLDLGDTSIGLVEREVRRIRLRLRPSWTRAVTQRTSITLEYRLTDESFSDEEGTALVDNDTQVLAVRWSNELSQRNSMSFTTRIGRNRAPDRDSTTDDVTILGGITHTFSPTFKGTLSAGFRDTTFERGALEDTDSGTVYQARLTKRSELTRLVAILRRDLNPTGIGRVVQTDELVLRMRRELSQRLTFTLRARLFRDKALEGDPTNVDRDYAEVQPGLRWRWTRQRSVIGFYRYRRRKFDAADKAADSNAIFVGVAFRGAR